MHRRTSVVTWQRHAGRAEELAAAVGGRTCHVYLHRLSGGAARTLLRYVLSLLLTAAHLVRHRPRSVIVTNPPVFPGLLVHAYTRLTGRVFVLDSHPASFGAKDNEMSRRLLPLHRMMARRASAVMVTTDHWVEVVASWGGRGLVVHEAPPRWEVATRSPVTGRPRVLFVGVFGSDEPVDVVFEAARALPDVDFDVTGEPERCPQPLRESLPPNVRLVGFLGPEDYRRAVEAADVLLVLTTEPTSVVRAGYEAVYARRALVVTGTPVLREVFPLATHTDNDAASVAAAVRSALAVAADDARHEKARNIQMQRWEQQVKALESAMDGARG